MLFSFLVTLREGVEIALVLAIVLGYLARTNNREHFRPVWLGAGAAALFSLGFAGILQLTATELSGAALEAFEGITMLSAVVVLTWMVFWTRRQAASLGGELRGRVDAAIRGGSLLALVGLAFSSVAREGIETALFLFAGWRAQAGTEGWVFAVGGMLGFALAAVVGYIVYAGSHRLPLRSFFLVSGIAVVILAAGLLTNGLAELQESGLIGNLGPRPWDTDGFIASTSTLGQLLHTLVGYDPSPTLGQIVGYLAYLGIGLGLFASDVFRFRAIRQVRQEVQSGA